MPLSKCTKDLSCITCFFFIRFTSISSDKNEFGLCNRYPPVSVEQRGNNYPIWSNPVVHIGNWCGEHKPFVYEAK